MTAITTAGTTIKVTASAPATFDAAGYAALSYTLIGEVTDLGEFGRDYQLVTHNPIDNRGTVKKKGSFNEGSIALKLALDNNDAGQQLLQAASISDANYTFVVTLQSGKKYYFQAAVMNFKVGAGSVNQITAASVQLEITTQSNGSGIILV